MFHNLVVEPATYTIFLKLLAAMICGVLIGTERIISHKSAGMRTYALVSLGAALFVIVGELAAKNYIAMGLLGINPLVTVGAIISGIGFMGAGMIIFRETNVTGLTTASAFWVAAGIGMACGYGFYIPAFMVTLLTLFIFIVLWHVEKHVKRFSFHREDDPVNK